MKQLAFSVIFFAFNIVFSVDAGAQGLLTKQAPLPCVNKTFTIVAHIVRDTFGVENITQAEILAALDSMNRDFEPICVDFEICAFRTIPNFQYDDIEDANELNQMFTYYNEERRINMYFITSSNDPFCGIATLAGIASPPVDNPAIAILKGDCMAEGTNTLSHEMGHFFGLYHTFEGSDGPMPELVDGSNCDTAGDLVCDTPADPYVTGDPVDQYVNEQDCRFIRPIRDGNNDWFVPDVGNIMSYYQSSCSCGFTYGQYVRMAQTFLNSDQDNW